MTNVLQRVELLKVFEGVLSVLSYIVGRFERGNRRSTRKPPEPWLSARKRRKKRRDGKDLNSSKTW